MSVLSHLIIPYDAKRYPFADIVCNGWLTALDVFGLRSLDVLHKHVTLINEGDDQDAPRQLRLYDIGEPFMSTYRAFIRDFVQPLIGERLLYQAMPTFRVMVPGSTAVSRFHTDVEYGHSPDEVNVWVPLTDVTPETAVWLESAADRADFQPVCPKVGQALIFAGATLRHGNVPNRSDKTRVSFDARVIPARLYKDTGERTINAGVPLRLGDYFAELAA